MSTAADRKRREERVKLGASALANLGTAFIVGGAIGPSLVGRAKATVLGVSVAIGFILHVAAQLLLHYVAVDVVEEAGS